MIFTDNRTPATLAAADRAMPVTLTDEQVQTIHDFVLAATKDRHDLIVPGIGVLRAIGARR